MYYHNKAQQSKNRVHISWDILYYAGTFLLIVSCSVSTNKMKLHDLMQALFIYYRTIRDTEYHPLWYNNWKPANILRTGTTGGISPWIFLVYHTLYQCVWQVSLITNITTIIQSAFHNPLTELKIRELCVGGYYSLVLLPWITRETWEPM